MKPEPPPAFYTPQCFCALSLPRPAHVFLLWLAPLTGKVSLLKIWECQQHARPGSLPLKCLQPGQGRKYQILHQKPICIHCETQVKSQSCKALNACPAAQEPTAVPTLEVSRILKSPSSQIALFTKPFFKVTGSGIYSQYQKASKILETQAASTLWKADVSP